jgi:hypothetical protein
MKNLLRYYLCLWILIAYTSCAKLDQLFTFTITNESSVTIPATGPVSVPFGISSPDIATNSSSSEAFASNHTDADHVKNIYLKTMELTITSPPNQTFDFLKSVHIYISTNSSNEIELAYLDSIPLGVDSIALIPTQSSLDQYVKAPSYNLRAEAVLRQGTTQDVNVDINSTFKVTANL